MSPYEVEWLLTRIVQLTERSVKNRSWQVTHSNIWQGSYDVWFCEQDQVDAVEIPKRRMKEAEEAGLIKSEQRPYGKCQIIVWSLTEAGHAKLKEIESKT